MKRFNKQNVSDYLTHQITELEKQWKFDPNNGYSQVANSDMQRIMAYGEYNALQNVFDAIQYQSL